MRLNFTRDHATRERLARGIAMYYYRKTLGVQCADPLQPMRRAELDEAHRRKVALARHTLRKLDATRVAPADQVDVPAVEEFDRANVLQWQRQA